MEEVPTDENTIDEEPIDDKKPILPSWAKYIFITLGLGVVVLYFLMSGWGAYAYTYVKCGIKQPLIASTSATGRAYYTPEHRRYSAPGEGTFFGGYYCTEAQAQAAGFLRAAP